MLAVDLQQSRPMVRPTFAQLVTRKRLLAALAALGLALAVLTVARWRGSKPTEVTTGTPSADGGASPGSVACTRVNGSACECVRNGVETQLALGLPEPALARLEGASACHDSLRVQRAEALALLGRIQEARAELDRAAAAPTLPSVRRVSALLELESADLQSARERLLQLTREHPRDVTAQYALGLAEWRMDKYGAARTQLLRTLAIERDHVLARYQLVVLTHTVGAAEEAKYHLDQLKQIAPIGATALVSAQKLLAERKTAEAP